MESDGIGRKQFIVLSFTLIGSAAAAGCSGGGGGSTTGTGGAGGTGGPVTCDDPLGSMQLSDANGHTHTVTVPMAALQATPPQMFTTSSVNAHTHTISLSAGNLTTIGNGGSVMVTSSTSSNHTHTYRVSCRAA